MRIKIRQRDRLKHIIEAPGSVFQTGITPKIENGATAPSDDCLQLVIVRFALNVLRLGSASHSAECVMEEAGTRTITGLLEAIQRGEREAIDELFPLVYEELRIIAGNQRHRWHGDLTLNTTAIVHEAYLKLADGTTLPANSRAHFFAVAATAMRHVLCNYARDRQRLKRGGNAIHVSLGERNDVGIPAELSDEHAHTLSVLDEALRRLEEIAPRQARVVECRFFGGMGVEDTAAALGTSERTVKRDWNFSRAWLRREMQIKLDSLD